MEELEPDIKEVCDELENMFATDFGAEGAENVEKKIHVNVVYFAVSLPYGSKYTKKGFLQQIKTIFWMMMLEEPKVSSVRRSKDDWDVFVGNKRQCSIKFLSSGLIQLWVYR